MIFKIISVAAILFTGLSFLNLVVGKLDLPKKLRRHFDYSLALAGLIVFIAYFSWLLSVSIKSENNFLLFFLALAFLLFIIPAFVLIRDLIFGVFLKMQNKIPEGVLIEVDDIKGKIVKAGHFYLEIEDVQGNTKSINYYKLKSKIISSFGNNKQLEKLEFVLKLPVSNNFNELAQRLQTVLLNAPWVAVSRPIKIEKIKLKDNYAQIKVGVFSLSQKYEQQIKALVEKSFY